VIKMQPAFIRYARCFVRSLVFMVALWFSTGGTAHSGRFAVAALRAASMAFPLGLPNTVHEIKTGPAS
jgi:hypothetical protein